MISWGRTGRSPFSMATRVVRAMPRRSATSCWVSPRARTRRAEAVEHDVRWIGLELLIGHGSPLMSRSRRSLTVAQVGRDEGARNSGPLVHVPSQQVSDSDFGIRLRG